MADRSLRTVEAVALVAVGRVAGANLRYVLALFLPGPGGTLLANVTGSAALGVLLYEALHAGVRGWPVVAVG